MEITKLNNKNIALIKADGVIIKDGQSALDLIMSARYDSNCSNIIINKESIDESFFDLRTGFAGEIMQKFTNYRFRVAIVGDFSIYTGKNLQDFLYESNQGNAVFFVNNIDAAVEKLDKS